MTPPTIGDILHVDDGWVRRLRVVCVDAHRVGVRNISTSRRAHCAVCRERNRRRVALRRSSPQGRVAYNAYMRAWKARQPC